MYRFRITPDGVEQWYNLTITNPTADDLGDYNCVAENQGGVAEKTVVLTFDDPATFYANGGGVPMTDEQFNVVVGVSVAVAVLFLLVTVVCCAFCLCGRDRKKAKGANKASAAHEMSNGYDSQRLLNGGSVVGPSKPPRAMNEYQETEMQDMQQQQRTPSVISDGTRNSGGSCDGATRPMTSLSRYGHRKIIIVE